jgi:hypothetical protein
MFADTLIIARGFTITDPGAYGRVPCNSIYKPSGRRRTYGWWIEGSGGGVGVLLGRGGEWE